MPKDKAMNPSIGSRVEHHGQTLIVGHGGRLYAPHAAIDAWGRPRQTQKVTKYRLVTCGCRRTFIAHDGRMKTCEACQAHAQQKRRTRRTAEAQQLPTPCIQCGQRLTAQRRTQRYCSRACQQQAYRERHPKATEATPIRRGS